MKKLNLLFILMLLLFSCRNENGVPEESLQQNIQTERIGAFVKFENSLKNINPLAKSEDNSSYAIPFSEIIRNYLNTHPQFKDNLEKDFGTIDLSVASQTFGAREKIVFFPIVKNNKVSFIVGCVVNQNRDFVIFRLVSDKDFLEDNIKKFQQYYDPPKTSNNTAREIAIEEIVLTASTPVTEYEWMYNTSFSAGGDPSIMDGGVGVHGGSTGGTGANQNIIDKLDGYVCAQDLLKQLGSLNNDLAKLLQETFGTSENINITFRAKDGLGDVDGQRSSVDTSSGQFNVTIDLNSSVLKNSTKEYILVTMYHEFIHAYLGYQVKTLPYNEYLSKFPKVTEYQVKNSNGEIITKYNLDTTHKNYGPFIESMKDAVISFNSKISPDLAIALAKYGVVTDLSQTEIKLNQNERDTTQNKFIGTKCP